MKRKASLCLLAALALLAALPMGCAGPNRLSRGLDLRVNQLYVDSPTLAEVLLPVTFVGQNVAVATDMCFVNPWYFWNDVRVGRGTAYFYADPVTPENADPNLLPRVPEGAPAPYVPPPGERVPEPLRDMTRVSAPAKEATRGTAEALPHTVTTGDTLASISRRYYGRSHDWKRIYMANQSVLTSPDALRPGQVLVIPPVE